MYVCFRYHYTLKEYLSIVNLSFRERLKLLVQLFEGVAHLGKHGVAHRDMKSDNILLDTSHGKCCSNGGEINHRSHSKQWVLTIHFIFYKTLNHSVEGLHK